MGIVYIPKIEISGDINKSKDDAFGIIEYHINEILSILKIFGDFMTEEPNTHHLQYLECIL